MGICAELSGNPRSVGSNFLVGDLTLQDLLDARAGGTEIVTCDSSGLTGTPYEIFGFRNNDPGSGDIEATAYGIAEFYIDVEAPNPPRINTDPQRQATFNITWGDPDPPDLIQRWSFLFSDTDDPTAAAPLGITASLNERSQTISAQTLGLGAGESGYVFMTVFDQAFVSNELGGNESAVSEGVMVTNVAVTGFCDATGECSSCSASPMSLASTNGPSQIAWVLGLLLLVAYVVRRRR
jgi:MYXO-CTERM domain-containing protein